MTSIFFPQLNGAPTQHVDCGPSSTRSGTAWGTRNEKRPNVKQVRRRMRKPTGTTNPADWGRALDSYGVPNRVLIGERWDAVEAHLANGKMALIAVDYGLLRRLAPQRVGSRTFSGFHAIPCLKVDAKGRTKSLDPLLDGRYKGCPKGPVWMPLRKIERAAEEVGRDVVGRPSVWAVLVDRVAEPGSGVGVPLPEPDDEPVSLSSVLADLEELAEGAAGALRDDIEAIADDLRSLIGPYGGPAREDDEPESGVST